MLKLTEGLLEVNAPDTPPLARRLRALREAGLGGQSITQRQLAKAFSSEEPTSAPLISSWETGTAAPPSNRLDAYARFFATKQSVAREPYRLLPAQQLNAEERRHHKELIEELTDLRDTAQRPVISLAENLWRFLPGQDITFICAELPEELWHNMSYADPASPDYVKSYRFTDLDALIEIYGHVRALNPTNKVSISTPPEARSDLFTAHLVVLGGVDFNNVTRDLFRLIDIPVRQMERDVVTDVGGYEVIGAQPAATFKPILQKVGERNELFEDVAHFYRGPNPLNKNRTVTLCSGMYARGTLGAIRALTDPRFRDRNAQHVEDHLGLEQFSIISRVRILSGEVVTPDWTRSDVRLHQWPEASSERSGVRP